MRKTPYQKYLRTATFLCRIFFCLACCGIFLSGGNDDVLWAAPGGENRAPKRLTQSAAVDASHLFLLPVLDSSLILLTHTLDARVATGNPFILQIEAAYRLHNDESEALTATLLVAQSASAAAAGRPLPQNIALTLDGQPLALQSAGATVGQSVQVEFDADARRRLVLRYDLPLSASQTIDFHYPIPQLLAWPTDINGWRVTIDFGAAQQWLTPSDSWLQIGPRGWEMRGGRLQWLREERQPTADILFQSLHPLRIQEIQAARNQIRASNEPESLQWLGDLYAQLYQAPNVSATTRERFYDQALAAYTQALRLGQERGRQETALAAVRYQLAALYRMRAIAADGSVDSAYVALMVAEAELALPALPQGPTRLELQNWVAQGLRQQLRSARLQENWPQALLLTDRLAKLPADVVDPASLETERRTLILHEVLQQLQDGNEEAAVALVGEEILAGELLPRPEYRALFANWQITVTLNQDFVSINLLARPIAQRRADSGNALNSLLNSWSSAGVDDAILTEDASGFHIELDRLDARKRRLLVEGTPQQPDWALLRTVFLTAEQKTQQETRLLWRRTTKTIDVDFRPVGDQWHTMAATLEREATAAADEAAGENIRNPAEAAAQEIRNSLREARHRMEAGHWRRLVTDSTVQVVIGDSSDTASPQRVWLVGMTDAPQRLSAHVESISAVRLWLAVALGIMLTSLFAGVLWLLL